MIQNYTGYKVLRVFFDYPTKGLQLRELSRLLKMGMPSVILHVKRLEKEDFLKKEKKGVYPQYKASRNEKFLLYKKTDTLIRLHESGLIEFLFSKTYPNAIVLFGSASLGEDTETSDIDLFVIAKEKDLDLSEYEKMLKRKVHIIFESDLKKVPKELMNNVINGIVVYGYLEVL